MKRRFQPTQPWSSWEACLPADEGWKKPVAEALYAGRGDRIETALGKMYLVQQLGFPKAHQSVEIGEADDNQPRIWILKCKPSCWRLYFHYRVYEDTDKRIIYLHAVCKTQDDQDPQDSKRARRILDQIEAETARIARFQFPAE